MTQTEEILKLREEIRVLRQRNHNLESDLSYHVKKEAVLEEKVRRMLKGAISTEYGAFIGIADEFLYKLEIGTTKEHLKKVCLKHLREYLGTDKAYGALAIEINRHCFGVLESLLIDYPEFGAFEVNLFSCMMINVRDSVIMETFDLGTPAKTASAKHTLIRRIRKLRNIRYLKYLKLLDKNDCTYGKKLLSLYDLSKFSNGKPEKNKD